MEEAWTNHCFIISEPLLPVPGGWQDRVGSYFTLCRICPFPNLTQAFSTYQAQITIIMPWFILLSPVYLYHQLFILQRHCFCAILLLVKPHLWNTCWTPKPGILSEGLYFSTLSLLSILVCVLAMVFRSVQFSHSVMSGSLPVHGLQHARLPCPSPTPGACSNSCLSSHWYHPTISSSVILFSSCLHSFPASGFFPISQLFTLGGQNIPALTSASVLPMNIQDWFPLGLTGWISLNPRDSQESSPTPQFKSITSVVLSFLDGSTLKSIYDY